jgi:hypothetical protein
MSPSPIVNRACRSPGIPVGVSSKAALSYNVSFEATDEDDSLFFKIDTSGLDSCFGAVPGLLADDYSDPIIAHRFAVPKRSAVLTGAYQANVAGRFDIPTTKDAPTYPHGKVNSRVFKAGTPTYKFVIQLVGFYWNRSEGLQSRL